MNRPKLILAVLLVLFVCSLVYSFIRMPRQKRVEKLKYQQGMTAEPTRTKQAALDDTARVRLDLLDQPGSRAHLGGRNIFRGGLAGEVKKTKIPLPPPPPPPQKVEPPVTAAPPSQPTAIEPTALQRDMATFTFLGFLKKEGRKTIFLSNGKEIFLVKKGDRIAGKYDVTSLTEDILTISSLQDGGEILIPLVENKPLSAPRK